MAFEMNGPIRVSTATTQAEFSLDAEDDKGRVPSFTGPFNRFGVILNGDGWWLSKRYFMRWTDGLIYESDDRENWETADRIDFTPSSEVQSVTVESKRAYAKAFIKPILDGN